MSIFRPSIHGNAELFWRRSFGDLAQGEVIRGELCELLGRQLLQGSVPGGNCIKMGLPGKLILSKGKGLWEVLFS